MDKMWNYVNISVQGTSHKKREVVCQDSNSCVVVESPNNSKTLISIVSDGAGSAKKSEIGSKLICEKFTEYLKNCHGKGITIEEISKELITDWLRNFQIELREKAESEGFKTKDFACTFLVAIVGEISACFAQIGDGAIIIKNEEGNYSFMFLPQQGEFANETFFVTDDDATNVLEFVYIEKAINEIALFTDGIQYLVIDFENLNTNEEFFLKLFQWLVEIKDQNIGNLRP